MLYEQPRGGSRARDGLVVASPAMILTPQGLMLGAGTILVPAEGTRKLQSLKGREQHVLALLSAAYGAAVAPSVLGNIERAAKSWSEGDDFTAHIHLAHTGLRALDDFPLSAHRLRMAKGALDHGATPLAIFRVLRLDARYIDALEKRYNPEQPRVQAGHPDGGQWTRGDSGAEAAEHPTAQRAAEQEETQRAPYLGRMPPPVPPVAPSALDGLSAPQILQLSLFAARVLTIAGGAAAVFGLLFIPDPDNVHVEEDVKGIPGLRYSWNRDETKLYLKYERPGAPQRTVALRINDEDVLDDEGRVVGKVIEGKRIAIDTLPALHDLLKQDEPRLCPAYQRDRPGSDRGKKYEDDPARQYEDFVKALINPPPDGPTPSGFVYYLPNPEAKGKPVSFDDCEWKTGSIMFEIKGENNAKMLTAYYSSENAARDMLDQSARQIAASGGRPIVWIFAEKEAARIVRKLFDEAKDGQQNITVVHIPWTRSNP